MTNDHRPSTIDHGQIGFRFAGSIVYGLLSMVLIASCGYTTKSTLPSGIKTIHVETFKNNIDFAAEGRRNLYLPLLEIKVRNAVINRFLFDGNLKIADADKADLVLKGQLLSYDRKGETDWTESGFVGEATYFVTGASARSEEAAVEDAITDLARRIVERTVEAW